MHSDLAGAIVYVRWGSSQNLPSRRLVGRRFETTSHDPEGLPEQEGEAKSVKEREESCGQ